MILGSILGIIFGTIYGAQYMIGIQIIRYHIECHSWYKYNTKYGTISLVPYIFGTIDYTKCGTKDDTKYDAYVV